MIDQTTETDGSARRRTASHRRERGRRRALSPAARYTSWGLGAFLALLLLLVAVDAFASAGRVHPGVTVGGVKIGGKTVPEASALLKKDLAAKAANPIIVTCTNAGKSKSWTVTADMVGASFDYPALLDTAMNVGRTGGFFASVGARTSAWFGGQSLPASATADPVKLKAAVDEITSTIDVAPRDATLKITPTKVTVLPSADGLAIQRVQLERDLLGTFAADNRTIVAHVDVAKPKISDAAATAAKSVVETMIAGPASITYGTNTWTITVAELAKLIALQPLETTGTVGAAWILNPVVSSSATSKTVVPKLGSALGTPPRDARFVTKGGNVVIVPSRPGVGADVDNLAETLTSVLKNNSRARTVELQTRTAQPKFTTEQAHAMGIHERISTFTTDYSSGMTSRVNNIHLLGSALDGKLVPPGATFSFNGYVGERTAAKGYEEANAIVKGKLVPQLGGGICQVGTTMFNTVFFSGMPVLERQNHSFFISHYPTGRDATVSWGGPDLKWKNTTPNWMMVSVSYTSGSITISLYGTSPGYTVSYTTSKFSNPKPYPTEKQPDPTLQTGVTVVQDPGIDGRTVSVTRTVKKGTIVVRTDTFTSVYQPKIEVVRVGTKAKASGVASQTPPPKKP